MGRRLLECTAPVNKTGTVFESSYPNPVNHYVFHSNG